MRTINKTDIALKAFSNPYRFYNHPYMKQELHRHTFPHTSHIYHV